MVVEGTTLPDSMQGKLPKVLAQWDNKYKSSMLHFN